jgi:hypothetical protein
MSEFNSECVDCGCGINHFAGDEIHRCLDCGERAAQLNADHFTVHVDNLDDREGCVMVTVTGEGARKWAEWNQSIAGSNWECVDDGYAYAVPCDYPTLLDDMKAEGYTNLDLSEYSPPDEA